jgi:hypothetical protein
MPDASLCTDEDRPVARERMNEVPRVDVGTVVVEGAPRVANALNAGEHELDAAWRQSVTPLVLIHRVHPRLHRCKLDGDKVAGIDGELTIKGVTKPVTLAVTSFNCGPHPFTKKPVCGANASTKIKRSEFNAGKNVPAVSDEVTLTIAVEAVKE